ncbi:MAG: glycoside hydrolase family 2, partial [Lachnospiraceae bacterium]|nr:glycoside hydrolase family 2 [Lachnospiraceae bacterium]
MIQLVSRWGKELDKEYVLKEYPRPGLVRDSYLNLNGEWEYCISTQKETDYYDGTIIVPFSP